MCFLNVGCFRLYTAAFIHFLTHNTVRVNISANNRKFKCPSGATSRYSHGCLQCYEDYTKQAQTEDGLMQGDYQKLNVPLISDSTFSEDNTASKDSSQLLQNYRCSSHSLISLSLPWPSGWKLKSLNGPYNNATAKLKVSSVFIQSFNGFYSCSRNLHCCYRLNEAKVGFNQRNFCKTAVLSTEDSQTFTDSNLNVVEENNTNIRKPPPRLRRFSKPSRNSQTKTSKRIQRILPHLFSEDGEPLPTLTVEKQLLGLMQMWAMDEAVDLLKQSVQDGVDPDRTVVLNLLQQLANLGEVECLLELHEFLKDRGLSTNLKFYHCLRDAYFNSGRVEDGILMLRVIYHGSRDFDDTDLLFTLLATMTARHFEHMLPVVESYVTDLEESDPPVTLARASLWRCLVLAEKFDKADKLLEEFPEVKKMVPAQVSKLVQSQLEVDYDRDTVLKWLMNSPYVKPGLAASLFDMLILHKSTEGQWNEGLKYLSSAMDEGRKIHRKTVETFLAKFFNQLPLNQVQDLSNWASGLQNPQPDHEDSKINS